MHLHLHYNSCINIYNFISQMERKKICRFFEKGSCKKSNCPFVHLKQTRKNCQFYLQGYCKKGDICNFYHPPKQKEPQEKKQYKKQSKKQPKQEQHAHESEEDAKIQDQQRDLYPEEKIQEKQTNFQQQHDLQKVQKVKKINYLLGINSQSQSQQQSQSQKSIQQKPSIHFFKVYPKKFPDYSKTPEFKEFIAKNQDRYFKEGFMNIINKLTDPAEKEHHQIIRRFQDSFRQSMQSPRIYTINIKPLTFLPEIQLCFPFKEDTIDISIDCTNYPQQKASIRILNESIPIQFKEKMQSFLKSYHTKKNLFETLKYLQNSFEKIYQDSKFKLQNQYFSRKDLNKRLKQQQEKQQKIKQGQVKKKIPKKKSANTEKQNPHATIIPYSPGEKPDTISFNYDITVESLNIAGCQYIIIGRMLLYIECVCQNQIMIILQGNQIRDLKFGVKLKCKKCQVQIRICIIRQILQYKATTLGKMGIDNGKLLDIGGIAWRIGCQCDNQVHMNKIVLSGVRTNLNCHSCFKNMSIIYNGLKHFNPFLKQPQIQADKQILNKGCCKHMKLSFRKFRYACCGRIFSCDQCHNNQSIIPHQFVHGVTMLCGFCSFEQPVSENCINCKKQVLKGVLKTGHWEGGMGCRDQTQLSRHDAKKFSGLTKKKQK